MATRSKFPEYVPPHNPIHLNHVDPSTSELPITRMIIAAQFMADFYSIVQRFIQGSQICQDYQEIRVQENVKNMNMGTIPRSIIVVLQDDLVDSVQAGTDVIITGIVRSRWARLQPSRPCELQLFVEATHMECHSAPPSELHSYKREFDAFWLDHARGGTLLSARNLIVDSISPELFALSLVKLAVALCVTGGCDNEFSQDGMQLRGQSHLLLVGSPGTGKSQLLRSATRLCARSVLTTGIGTTAAGLSAACVRDSDGEMGLEAGALVLSDRGICCIDEFASIRTTDISTIHEAMEQQTISIAKAGIVCTLNTRATVLAAMNPRPTGFQTERDLAWNLGLEAPLLSRFDLVMLLLDQHDLDRDQEVAAHVLDQHDPDPDDDPVTDAHATTPHWPIEKLRAYFDEIKQLRPVRMSQHARLVLQRYYQLQRQQERSRGRTTIRLMESLIRLSQAHARLMYRPFVLARDAVQAVICLECSIHTSVLLGAASVLHSRFGPNPELEYQKQENIILKMLKLDAVPEEERNFNYEQWILDGTDPFNNEFVQHIAEPIDLGPDIDSTTSLGNLREPDDDDDLDSGDLYQTFTQCPPNIRPTFFK